MSKYSEFVTSLILTAANAGAAMLYILIFSIALSEKQFSAIVIWSGYFVWIQFALDFGITNYLLKCLKDNQKLETISSCLSVFSAIAIPILITVYFFLILLSESIADNIRILILLSPIMAISVTIPKLIFVGLRHFNHVNLSNALYSILHMAPILFILIKSWTSTLTEVDRVIIPMITGLVCIFFIIPIFKIKLKIVRSHELQDLIQYTIKYLPHNIIHSFIAGFDRIYLSNVVEISDLNFYYKCKQGLESLRLLSVSIQNYLSPNIVASIREKNSAEVKKSFYKFSKLLSGAIILSSVFALVLLGLTHNVRVENEVQIFLLILAINIISSIYDFTNIINFIVENFLVSLLTISCSLSVVALTIIFKIDSVTSYLNIILLMNLSLIIGTFFVTKMNLSVMSERV